MTLAERAAGPTIARRQMAPPHSAEAEESVIGAVLRSPPTADDVFDRLATEDFYVPACADQHRTARQDRTTESVTPSWHS